MTSRHSDWYERWMRNDEEMTKELVDRWVEFERGYVVSVGMMSPGQALAMQPGELDSAYVEARDEWYERAYGRTAPRHV